MKVSQASAIIEQYDEAYGKFLEGYSSSNEMHHEAYGGKVEALAFVIVALWGQGFHDELDKACSLRHKCVTPERVVHLLALNLPLPPDLEEDEPREWTGYEFVCLLEEAGWDDNSQKVAVHYFGEDHPRWWRIVGIDDRDEYLTIEVEEM